MIGFASFSHCLFISGDYVVNKHLSVCCEGQIDAKLMTFRSNIVCCRLRVSSIKEVGDVVGSLFNINDLAGSQIRILAMGLNCFVEIENPFDVGSLLHGCYGGDSVVVYNFVFLALAQYEHHSNCNY